MTSVQIMGVFVLIGGAIVAFAGWRLGHWGPDHYGSVPAITFGLAFVVIGATAAVTSREQAWIRAIATVLALAPAVALTPFVVKMEREARMRASRTQ